MSIEQAEEVQDTPPPTAPETCITLGGLHEDLTHADVSTLLIGFGEIVRIQLAPESGTAAVEFASIAAAYSALLLDGHPFAGMTLSTATGAEFKHQAPGEAKRAVRDCDSIFIRGVPTDKNDDDIKDICTQFGEVTKVTKRAGARHAFVDFATSAAAQMACLNLDGMTPWEDEAPIEACLNTRETREGGNARKRTSSQAGLPEPTGRQVRDCQSIFLTQLPPHCTEEEVIALVDSHLSGIGSVTKATKQAGRSFCFVDVSSKEAAAHAIGALHGLEYEGRELVCRLNLPEFKRAHTQTGVVL